MEVKPNLRSFELTKLLEKYEDTLKKRRLNMLNSTNYLLALFWLTIEMKGIKVK